VPVRTRDEAAALARRYLDAMERRALDEAARCVAADAVLTFPGGHRRAGVADIVSGSGARYQFVGKHFEAVEAYDAPAGGFVVYCRGTLHGRWIDGAPFEGIRFVDRFEIDDNGIRRQDVWNDAAEHRLARAAALASSSEPVR
jgi:hypothetical protein